MQLFKLSLSTSLIMFLVCTSSMAQSTLSSGGNHSQTDDFLHTYIIGEMTLVHTATSPSLTITQGTLQPTDETLSVDDIKKLTDAIKIYPNPTRSLVYIDTYLEVGEEVTLQLTDVRGRLLFTNKTKVRSEIQQQTIDMSGYQTGTYILQARVNKNGKVGEQHFKILKH